MINWMMWATGFAIVIAIVAFALERVAVCFGIGRRHVWMLALVAAAVIPPALATQRRASARNAGLDLAGGMHLSLSLEEVPTRIGPPGTFKPTTARSAPEGTTSEHFPERWALYAWLTASLVLAGVFARMMITLRRQSAAWTDSEIDSCRALIAPDAGPAVIGFAHPRVVLPQWVLSLDRSARDLMVRHEMEHIRAGDPRTLFIAGALLVVFPWNAALWLIVRQLRHAMEFDCDARVIRAVGNPAEYGRVLLTVGERFTSHIALAAALTAPRPLLEQRIDAMTTPRPRRPMFAAAPFAAIAVLAGFGASRAPRPTPLPPLVFARASEPAKQTRYVPRTVDISRPALVDSALAGKPKHVPGTGTGMIGVFTPVARTRLLRADVVALARSRFPEIASGDLRPRFLVMVFDSGERFVRGFATSAGVMIQIEGDTLTYAQRHSLPAAQSANRPGANRAGRGGGSMRPGDAGGVSSRNSTSTSRLEMFGFSSVVDSAGARHPAPLNVDPGLSAVAPHSGESGIKGILARNVVHVDEYQVTTEDQFASQFGILAVHLNEIPKDTGDTIIVVRRGSLSYDVGRTQVKPEKQKAKVKQLVILPVPIPDGYALDACFEVAANGDAKLLMYTKSKDAEFNKKLDESLKGYKFTPATLNGVAVRDTACVKAQKQKPGG